MKVEMKNYVEYIIQKQWKPIVSVVRKILQAKIPVLERIKQNGLMLYQTALFVARKNQLSLKIKNYAILIKFQMIILRWIKSFPNFYWLETNLCQNCIQNSQDLLIVLGDHFLKIVKNSKI